MSLTNLLEGVLAGEMSALNIVFILGIPIVAFYAFVEWLRQKRND